MNFNKAILFKRIFDLIISSIGIVIVAIPIVFLMILAGLSTKSFGIFKQKRIGQFQKPFFIYKIRTMKINQDNNTFTTANDQRITPFGRFLRRYKLDELPQLWNVLLGSMSIVGPRPDVEQMAFMLTDEQKIIFKMKPGLISKATIQFLYEEQLLASKKNPNEFYLSTIWPQKVILNQEYVEKWSFINDLNIIKQLFKTLLNKSVQKRDNLK